MKRPEMIEALAQILDQFNGDAFNPWEKAEVVLSKIELLQAQKWDKSTKEENDITKTKGQK